MSLKNIVAKQILTQQIIKGALGCTTQLIYFRRTRVYNSGRLVVFVPVLGEGVKGVSLKECEAAFLRFPLHVVTKI